METLSYDLRHTFRQLRKSPGFTLTAILTLAFGIGATTAVFSIVEGVLLRPLPFAHPSRLVSIADTLEGSGSDHTGIMAPGMRMYLRDTQGFSSLGGYQQNTYELSGVGEPAQIDGSRLTASMFQVLGVSPVLGRTFTRQEDESSQPVAVLSYQIWNSRFHGNRHILGKKILLDRKPYSVIGVMPRDFEFPLVPGLLSRSKLWVPMSLSSGEMTDVTGDWSFQMVGRLRDGVSLAQAQQDVDRVSREIMRDFPSAMSSLHIHSTVERLDEATVAQGRPLVRTLFLAVAAVLLIACANLAGLLLVRVIRRRREIAVRLALGASNAAVLRQTLIETMTLSTAGGLLGLGSAAAGLRLGISLLPETLPRISAIGLDWRVACFALFLGVFTGLLCGVIPAFVAARTGINEALKESGRTGTAGGAHVRLRSTLVVAEVAVALFLLVASGLLLRSFQKLRDVDLGFRAHHLLTAEYSLPWEHYSNQATVDGFNDTLLRKLQQLPGVETVGITSQLPADSQVSSSTFVPEGYVPARSDELHLSWNSQVLGDYFRAAGIPLLRGRDFTESDRAGSPLVVIVNRTLAEHYWRGQDPIGKRLKWGIQQSTPTPWMTVVGEIGDVKQSAADAATREQIYQPASQSAASFGKFAPPGLLNGNSGAIVLRTSLPPEQMVNSLRSIVHSIDPQLPLTNVESMDRVIETGQASRRFNTLLISCFAGAAVLLALLGIYGVIAFSAALRTQEMAIRLALGSQRASIVQLILLSGAKLALIGCGIGAVVAVFTTRLLRSFLFQVDPLDPAIIGLAALSIFLLALAASLIPARRAASVEPIQALRAE